MFSGQPLLYLNMVLLIISLFFFLLQYTLMGYIIKQQEGKNGGIRWTKRLVVIEKG